MNLLQALPGYGQGYGLRTNYATLLPPGGRIAAYLGPQTDAIDQYAASNLLVSTMEQALGRCKAGASDTIIVLPGYAETFTGAALSAMVSTTRIIGVGNLGSANAPTMTLSGTGAGLAFDDADVVFEGMTIAGSTAAITGAVVITARGVNFVGNRFKCSGAFGANPPIAVTNAADLVFLANYITASSTDPLVEITGTGTTDMLIANNFFRQITSGDIINVANEAISGMIAYNIGKSAETQGAGAGMVVIGAAAATLVANCENYMSDESVVAGIVATGA